MANNSQCDLDVSDSYFNFTNNTGTISGVCSSGSCAACNAFEIATQCSGGIDDDCDGLIDGNDPNCQPPIVTINFPTNRTYFSSDLPLNFNVSLNIDTGSVQYSLDGGVNNKTMYNSGGGIIGQYFNATNSSIGDGNYTFRVYANDTWGNKNETEKVNFTFENTDLTACKNLAYAGQTYRLTANILTSGTCFTISANNITLDGQDFEIKGNGISGYGVEAIGRTNISIKNIKTSNFLRGIFFMNITSSLIQNNIINGTNGSNNYGIYLDNSGTGNLKDNLISGNVINWNGYYGLILKNSGTSVKPTNNQIFNNSLSFNGFNLGQSGAGIFIEAGNSSKVVNNSLNLGANGIKIDNSRDNIFTGGNINGSKENAILFTDSNALNNNITNITISNTNKNNYDIKFNVGGINGIYLIDMPHIGNYSFTGSGGTVYFKDSIYGEIRFLSAINGSGNNLTRDVMILNNTVIVRSDLNIGLNKSANVTFYGIGNRGFTNPSILRNNLDCGNACYNFTALNAINVIFNVTSWTNYSIGDEVFLSDCGVLNVTNRYYRVINNITTTGTCFTIEANNITLDGQGFEIRGDGDFFSDSGVVSTSRVGATIKNINITNFTWGVNFASVINSIIFNNTISSQQDSGIYFTGSRNNNISKNKIFKNSNYGIHFSNSDNNTIIDNDIGDHNSSGSSNGIYILSSDNNTLEINRISNNVDGIDFDLSSRNIIKNNTISFNTKGINMVSSQNNIFINNSFIFNIQSMALAASLNSFSGGIINNSKGSAIVFTSSSADDNNFTNIQISGTNVSFRDLRFDFANTDRTYLIDMPHIGNYSFHSGGDIVYFKDSRYGEIRFLSAINGSGTNLTRDVWIGNNSATVMSNINPGLNRRANVTLYGIGNRGFVNPVILRNGVNCGIICKNFTALNASEVRFNVTSWTNYSIGNSSNFAPNNPITKINSTDGSNKTKQDLNCYDTILDDDNNTMNVSVIWYNNSIFKFQFNYNNSYANGTLFSAILGNLNTTKGENWSCALRYFDGFVYTNWTNSTNLTILNSLPNVTLISPPNGNVTIDRTPNFTWYVDDDDNESVNSQLNLTCYFGCSVDNRIVVTSGLGNVSHEIIGDLRFLKDNNFYYNWSVRANDSAFGFSSWTNDWRIDIAALVAINFTRDIIQFGIIGQNGNNDTVDNSPPPFLIENIGNVMVNSTIYASDLWRSIKNPNRFYQFKVDNKNYLGSENGAFYFGGSITSYRNMTNSTNPLFAIVQFNYSDSSDEAEIDINLTVPSTEGSGVRNSTVVVTAELAE